jgi:KDEL-tailed cysteine endopeptidase
METPSISQNTRSSKTKFVAILTLAVLGSLAVSFLVFSNLPDETQFALKADDQTLKAAYAGWKKDFNVTYGGPEDANRFKVFTKTYLDIAEVNAQNLTYTLGLNDFSTMTEEEFVAIKLGYNAKALRASNQVATMLPTANLKATVDWSTKGAVNPVKNQGSCGSCWAFSAVGALEGLAAINGKIQDFSEQELVDCSRSYGNGGCNGGLMQPAFSYVKDKGISVQSAYPYKGVDGSCKTTSGNKFKISGHVVVPANNAAQLKAAIDKQPVSVAVQADASPFRSYKSGVLTGTACGTKINHAVLAVGYETSGTPYYKVKNSWGTSWGEKGYVRIGITDGAGVCGIQKDSSYPKA